MSLLKKNLKKLPLYGLFQYFRAKRVERQKRLQHFHRLRFYRRFVSPGDLVFDIGANYGNRTRVLLELGARVVAVEPQAECIARLRKMDDGQRLVVVPKVLGEHEGDAQLLVSKSRALSSVSEKWLNAVKSSGRFRMVQWDETRSVSMTTMDQLIADHGVPSFVKIDVEGFELPVIRGLSQPIKALSLEFAPEFMESTFSCMNHLETLGEYRFNHAIGEKMGLVSYKFRKSNAVRKQLERYRGNYSLFGDVYARLHGFRKFVHQ